MKRKNILITAGPTNEYIDEVMKITNMSTGKLGLQLSNSLLENYHVTLIGTRSVFQNALFERYQLDKNENFSMVAIETTEDLKQALQKEATLRKYDMIIHSSAVGDYKPDYTFRLEDAAAEIAWNITHKNVDYYDILEILKNPTKKVDDHTKISSYEPNLTVKLQLTEKIIHYLREWYPDSMLIGFKLLDHVSKEELIEVATKLREKNEMDYILANDLSNLRCGGRLTYLIGDEYEDLVTMHSSEEICDQVKRLLKSR